MNDRHSWPSRLPLYYGWVVVGIAFVTIGIGVNLRTAFSLLYPQLLDEFGWDRGVTAAAFAVGFIFSTALAPVIGVLMDRWGPRLVIPLGAILVSAGYVTTPWVTTPLGLYATLGLLVVGGSIAMSYIGHSMFLPNWFVRRRGLAVGLAFAGVGVGAIVLLPALQVAIDAYGWRTACLMMAGLSVIVVVPLNAILQRGRPADIGQLPDGDAATSDARPAPNPIVDAAWAATEWTVGRAARTSRFWWIFLANFTGLFVWYSVQVHQTRYLMDVGFGAADAAIALGLVGLFGVGGQIFIGALSDRIGREVCWAIANLGFVVTYGALLALAAAPSHTLMIVMVAFQGLLGYGLASLYGAITADIFGGPKYATIFALISLGGNIGAGFGPWLTGFLFDLTGTYGPAFVISIGLCLVSSFAIWMAAPRKVRLVAGQAARAPSAA